MDRATLHRLWRRHRLRVGAVFVVLGTAVFFLTRTWPLMRRLHHLRGETKRLEEEIEKEIEQLHVRGDLSEAIVSLQSEAERLRRLFPYREEEIMKKFREIAQQHQVAITSMSVSGKYDYTPKKGTLPQGVALQYIVLNVRVSGSYGHLIEFFSELNKTLPTYTNVERLIMTREAGTLNSLDVQMTLIFYVSKAQ